MNIGICIPAVGYSCNFNGWITFFPREIMVLISNFHGGRLCMPPFLPVGDRAFSPTCSLLHLFFPEGSMVMGESYGQPANGRQNDDQLVDENRNEKTGMISTGKISNENHY